LQSRPKRKIVFKKLPTLQIKKTPDTQARQKTLANDTNRRHKNGCNPRQTKTPAYNSTYKKLAVQRFVLQFFVDLNIRASYEHLPTGRQVCGEKRQLRQARNRYQQP
jgi:hypothetical protein